MTQIDTSTEAIAAIREKVNMFKRMELPGQPIGVHMGTFYLVSNLDELTAALAAERDRLAAQLAEARAEGWRKGIEAVVAEIRQWDDYTITGRELAIDRIRTLPMPADLEAR